MLKKIVLFLILSLSIFNLNFVNATLKSDMDAAKQTYEANKTTDNQKAYNNAKDAYQNSGEAAWDITAPWFQIHVNDISPWMWLAWWTAKENLNFAIWVIIQNLMIALWSLSLLIMTIWAWYILLHHGQDELLSKWKSIFMSWIIALIVALSSYYLVSILRYLLYNGN